jgi:DNA repair protein RecN (Recombination protein N)
MIEEVTAHNLGLIEKTTIVPSPHLTVITGETGTGKTLMLGALRLLRGENAPKGLIGPADDYCEVSARSVSDANEVILRRRIDANRSRAYIDDAAATAAALGEIMHNEIAIVGQHDQHTITSSAGVRSIVDHRLSSKGKKALGHYANAWEVHRHITAQIDALGSDPRAIERDHSMVSYQVDEIDAAGLTTDEDVTLKQRAIRLRNAETLAADVDRALVALGDEGVASSLSIASAAMGAASQVDGSLDDLRSRLNDLATTANDVTGDLAMYASSVDLNPVELDGVEERLATIAALKRKYGDTIEDILTFRKNAAAKVDELASLLATADGIEERLSNAVAALLEAGENLSAERTITCDGIASGAIAHLADLGFVDPAVEIEVQRAEPSPSGTDRLRVLFASDASLTPAPVSSIASGGELSRLVLALILGSGTAEASVVAFDEIDSGIGGATALAMGEKLAALAQDQQVICVTHLPQVAAFGNTHLAVERTGTTTTVREVSDADRVEELSRMLAGLSDSEKGQQHAAELLEMAARV